MTEGGTPESRVTGRETVGRGDRAGLERLLGVPEMEWLVARVRARIPDTGSEPLHGVVRLRDPSDPQRAAAVRLVGRPKRSGQTLRVDLADVEEILRRGPWPAGLADAVETLHGPVVDHRAEREREAAEWVVVRDGLAPAASRFPRLGDRWDRWCAAGGLKRIARAEAARTGASRAPAVGADLVRGVATVLDLLPAAGEPLSVLARRAVGDAHGLDDSRPLGRLVKQVVRMAFAPDSAESGPVAADGEMSGREVWAAAGVVLSNVASTVLCLGVPGVGSSGVEPTGLEPNSVEPTGDDAPRAAGPATGAALEAMRAARMPLLLTLDQVRSGGVRCLPRGSSVHVCENPTVVEVVAGRWARADSVPDATGARGPVLVCTWGQPSTAVVELLIRLTADGAECRYHGDFDWAGLRIAQSLRDHVAWVPWRFSAADYRAAVAEDTPSLRLTGSPADASWDPELPAAMGEHGLAIEEEAVAGLLATDLLARR